MRTYASSRVKRKGIYRKNELQTFLLISGGHIGPPKRYTNMASRYKALQKCEKTFRQITKKLWVTKTWDLDKIVYVLVFYNILFSWLLLLDGLQFIFLLRDSENDLYIDVWTVCPAIHTSLTKFLSFLIAACCWEICKTQRTRTQGFKGIRSLKLPLLNLSGKNLKFVMLIKSFP